jgi:hypothetical protein
MAKKVADSVEDAGEMPVKPVNRLCNEIQLFDLCDLEKCGQKQGLFCTSLDLLNRFEAIADDDERLPVADLISDGLDDGEAIDDDGYNDAIDDDQFGDEVYEDDDEDE